MTLTRRNFVKLSALMAAGLAAGPARVLAKQGSAPSLDAVFAFADYCLKTPYEALPAHVVAVTKNQILDTVAVALPALDTDGIKQLYALSRETGGKAESLVLGTAVRLPVANAARLNASMAAALEFDDTYEPSLLHASCVTIPVALAVADLVGGISGKELIAAVATGTDAACRLSRAGSPGISPFIVGWDPTPMYGFLASALVASRLMGLSREEAVSAVGIAYHQLSGNAQASVDGTHAKRLGAGFAAYGGILAARLAHRGVQGSRHSLEGVKGLFRQYHGSKYSKPSLLDGLGQDFAGPDIAPKPYPSCRGGHVAIDATMDLVKAHDLKPADIEAVKVYSPPAEMMLLGLPLEKKQNPQSIVEAQFSNPWMVAVTIQDREVGLRHFTQEALKREDLRQLAKRVVTQEDKTLVRPDGGPGFVRVEIRARDGKLWSKEVKYAKGDANNPMSAAEVEKKLYECTDAAGMGRAQATRIMQRMMQLEAETNVADLNSALAI